ncbi:MAG: hypothetical protein JXJ20_10340 [Anaerolineae bacterium]|nr:hypothetical protein [Anaerolineae bacterium]
MTTLDHGIVDCTGFEIVARLPWEAGAAKGWGFLVCKSGSGAENEALYGVIGPVNGEQIKGPGLGIPLRDAPDPNSALLQFALACSLSVIDKTGIELGDALVVAGANPLGLTALAAARQQGVRTACLVTGADTAANREAAEKLADAVIAYDDVDTFDDQLDTFAAGCQGKIAYADAAGSPEPVFIMAGRLERFGTLVFCRPDSIVSVLLALREVHHLRSARYAFWSRPETLEQALTLSEYYRRAVRLLQWERVDLPLPDTR